MFLFPPTETGHSNTTQIMSAIHILLERTLSLDQSWLQRTSPVRFLSNERLLGHAVSRCISALSLLRYCLSFKESFCQKTSPLQGNLCATTKLCGDIEFGPSPKLRTTLKAYSVFKATNGLRQIWAGACMTQLSDQFYFFPVSLSIVAQNPTWQTAYTLNSTSESASRNPVAINDKVFNLVNTYVSVSFYNLVSHVKANTIDVHIHAFHLIQTCHQHKIFFPNKKLFSTFVLNNYSIKCIRKMRKVCGINNFSVYSYSL